MSSSGGWSIDELARVAGVTARNVRAYQSQGLVAAPRLVGRMGRYDASHLDRVRGVQRLQARGFSLAGIKALFDAHDRGETLGAVLGLDSSFAAVFADPSPRLPRLALVPGPWAQDLEGSSPAVLRPPGGRRPQIRGRGA